jgi:uncharacterized protein (TIGR00730 family)
MNVLIFCSAQNVPEKYTNDAAEFATLLAQNGHTLVWGGSNVGTMKVIADAAQAAGGKIVGISMEFFAHKSRKNADEMVVTKDLSERKKVMLERADAVVVLAGGIGTLDEATEILALKRHGEHAKHVIFLDTDGFYDGFKMQLERMQKEGFLDTADGDGRGERLIDFATTPEEAMQHLAA